MRPCVSRTWLRVNLSFSSGAVASVAAKTSVVKITVYLISLKTGNADASYPPAGLASRAASHGNPNLFVRSPNL